MRTAHIFTKYTYLLYLLSNTYINVVIERGIEFGDIQTSLSKLPFVIGTHFFLFEKNADNKC